MNLLAAPYTPLLLTVIVVGLGVIYTNLRIANTKDVYLAETKKTRAALARSETSLRADIQRAAQAKD
ncbi:MAG TPA: hypothetical protein VGV35_05800 [Bryobacteraceae bacterium]|nr:hypothetical protein [Bryobacteraceae bacterium]